MLQEIERDPSAFIKDDNLAVYEGAGREPLAGTGNIRELVGEKISSPGPQRNSDVISARKTASPSNLTS